MKITVVDLRNKAIEQQIVVSLPGCGDGKLDTSTVFEEECDDGNNDSGDGCDQNCKVEESCNYVTGLVNHNCTAFTCDIAEGERTVCTPVICGNGVNNTVDGSGATLYE